MSQEFSVLEDRNRGYTSKLPFPTAILSHKIALMAYELRFNDLSHNPRRLPSQLKSYLGHSSYLFSSYPQTILPAPADGSTVGYECYAAGAYLVNRL